MRLMRLISRSRCPRAYGTTAVRSRYSVKALPSYEGGLRRAVLAPHVARLRKPNLQRLSRRVRLLLDVGRSSGTRYRLFLSRFHRSL